MYISRDNLGLNFTTRICGILFFSIFFSFQLIIIANPARAIELLVDTIKSQPGRTVSVSVNVAKYDQEQIAAAVFTLTYNRRYLSLVNVDSPFFHSFTNQWNLLSPVPDPLPGTSVVVDGQTYSKPLVHNTISSEFLNKTMVAGVRVKSGKPSALFTFTFAIDSTAPVAIYPISIQPTILNNTNAGYSVSGETVPILTDYVERESDPLLAYPSYSPSIINGMIIIEEPFLDSDNDGIEDNWELDNFWGYDLADSTSDFDKDNYTDLQEYLNFIGNETDTDGVGYDPKVVNAPGGTGYNPPSSSSSFWGLLLPGIIFNANEQAN